MRLQSSSAVLCALTWWFVVGPVLAQPEQEQPAAPPTAAAPQPDAGVSELPPVTQDANTPTLLADAGAPVEAPVVAPAAAEEQSDAPAAAAVEAAASDPNAATEAETQEAPAPPKCETAAPTKPSAPPLTVWATAAWANALGPARCRDGKLDGAELGLRVASTLKRSVAAKGIGISAAGALGDHPLLAHAAEHQPEQLAVLFSEMGYSALAAGIADLSGPLLRQPTLGRQLAAHNVPVVASNLKCNHQDWCESWITAEDPLLIIARGDQRYAFIAVLPDDTITRANPASGQEIALESAADTMIERTREARAAHADLVIVSIDHGPDPTAAVSLASFVAELPQEGRPDIVLSPSSAENWLFLRPRTVRPAVAGTRAHGLTWMNVTLMPETGDADVLARAVRLGVNDAPLAASFEPLANSYCASRSQELQGGKLDAPLTSVELVDLAASTARQQAGADLAIVDPLVFYDSFLKPRAAKLQRGEMERAVVLDSPLVVADVSLDWLTRFNKLLDGPRPLVLLGAGTDRGDPTIAGRVTVVGALYRVVTTLVLARSGRLPDGAIWSGLDQPDATLRGALLAHLSENDPRDPRARLHDPAEDTQWLLRTDGQVQGNYTGTRRPGPNGDNAPYSDEPALQVNDSRQLGARLVINLDADAPKFLFENALQLAFDRNFATKTTAQDLAFIQSTYTYRGLWPRPLLYPHPFVEGYVETQFDQGAAAYHHLMLRPKVGVRSIFSRVLSLKVAAGFQYEVLAPDPKVLPGIGAELVMRPWTLVTGGSTIQMEGNVSYFWASPGDLDQHTLRGQLITAIQIIGPLQFTLTALGVLRKDPDIALGRALSVQAGLRLRFIERLVGD